ncbi:uncharacterized protein O3C94_010570 [Discoglossus pictus]
MSKDKKRMMKRVLNHSLELITLLTGEVPLIQHLINSLVVIDMNKGKRKKILNHALEIIYLLTGEEYSIVKKKSPHSRIHKLTGECDIDEHKEMMEEDHQTLRTGIQKHKSSGLQDEHANLFSIKGEDQIDEKDILQVTIQSDLCVADLHDENMYSASINEDGKYDREEKEEIQSDPGADCHQ